MASEYFSASRADWCALCKCFVQPHGNAKRMHERSEKHKKNVEKKLKDIRHKEANEKKERDAWNKTMADIGSRAAEAYAADLAAAGRFSEAAAMQPKSLTAAARLREQEANAKRELEVALEREIQAKEEEAYRATQVLGAWKFDDRAKYYWHAKSQCYFDPKSKMYFNNTTKAWLKSAPEAAPPPPSAGSTPGSSSGQYALNPYARGVVTPSVAISTPESSQPVPTAKQAIAAAMALNQKTVTKTPVAVTSRAASKPEPSTAGTTTTSMFNLGFGANHPKFEAAKAKTQTSAARALVATGGRSFQAQLMPGSSSSANASHKRPASAIGSKSAKIDMEEAMALKRREAARARVEARTKQAYGLG